MLEILVAPCGMNCGVCAGYLAMQNDLKRKGFAKTYCPGCLPRGKNCAFMKKACKRLGEGLVRFCYECTDFPCPRLKRLDKRYRSFYHMSMIENLKFIKERGMENFLKREAEKWKCPECGVVISCHNGVCFRCHPEDLRNREVTDEWTGRHKDE